MRYADLHCDFLSYLAEFRFGNLTFTDLPSAARSAVIDSALNKWKSGGCKIQCFALFCKGESEADRESIQTQRALYQKIKPAFEALTGGKAVLTVEGGATIGATRGELTKLSSLFDSGVKIFSPVWNNQNSLSAPCGAAGGLTKKGKEAIAYALERGAIPDISHASDGAARDIFALAAERKKAVCATHSMVRALCPHVRNLTDTQIKKIAESGGVAGVNFVRDFAGKYPVEKHVEYLVNLGGEDMAAIGSDFYGTERPYPENPEKMPEFFRALEKKFTPRQLEKFAFSNAARLLL